MFSKLLYLRSWEGHTRDIAARLLWAGIYWVRRLGSWAEPGSSRGARAPLVGSVSITLNDEYIYHIWSVRVPWRPLLPRAYGVHEIRIRLLVCMMLCIHIHGMHDTVSDRVDKQVHHHRRSSMPIKTARILSWCQRLVNQTVQSR